MTGHGNIFHIESSLLADSIQKDLTRRITNLDAKLWAIQLMLDRIELLESELLTL